MMNLTTTTIATMVYGAMTAEFIKTAIVNDKRNNDASDDINEDMYAMLEGCNRHTPSTILMTHASPSP